MHMVNHGMKIYGKEIARSCSPPDYIHNEITIYRENINFMELSICLFMSFNMNILYKVDLNNSLTNFEAEWLVDATSQAFSSS